MNSFTSRQLAATMVLATSAWLTLSIAGEAPTAAPAAAPTADPAAASANKLIMVAVPSAPPKDYVIPKKGVSDAIRKAVENPARRKEDIARDGYRKPAEVLALAGVKAGQKIIEFGSFGEFDSFGQYYTTLLAEVVGPKGMVYMYDPPDLDAQLGGNSRAFAEAHPNTKYEAGSFDKIQFPRGIDIAFSNLYYHEILLRGTNMTVFHDKLFKALKPGGIYLIIDHAGVIGEDLKKTLQIHRIDPQELNSGVRAAGFTLVVESRILERTDDDHRWPVFTEGKRDQTDQTVYMFRKPVVY
ncbi:MAG: hypothetical protein ABIQ86_16970 [Steroidobacteraceae bacterium]